MNVIRHGQAALLAVAWILCPAAYAGSSSPAPEIEIASALSLTGDSYTFGNGSLEGIRLAVDEANTDGVGPHIKLVPYDNQSSEERAREVAARVIASPAALVLGPSISTLSLASGALYAEAGVPSITTTATSDLITQNPTTFRVLFKNSAQGEMLAAYVNRVLGAKRADVAVVDDAYGHTLERGFREAAERLGIDAKYFVFKTSVEAQKVVEEIAADPAKPPVVLATLDGDGARMLPALRRLGVVGPFLGGDAFGDESFSARLVDLPEEKKEPGYFSRGLYGISPMILDSANAEILAFAERFHARFGHDPVWFAVAAYDAARAAIQTARVIAADGASDVEAQRSAALRYLLSLDDPQRALPGLLGPIYFG
ncbi:MAG TPA: ABC transporter substrate-binding protein, partial [Chthoniobacteraceae bacterium]